MSTISTNYRTQIMSPRPSAPVKKMEWKPSEALMKRTMRFLSEFCVIPSANEIENLKSANSAITFEQKRRTILMNHLDNSSVVA